jgi:CheY-like chemotaxis protein
MEGDAEKYIALGMDDYITKPLEPEVLLQKLSQWSKASGSNSRN